jgi:hypothetical protein
MRFRVLLLCDDRPSHADTILSHIAALSEATDHHVFKFNSRGWLAAEMIDVDEFDVIIVHYSIAINFETYLPKVVRDAVRRFTGLKVLFIQDEYRDVNRCVSSMIELGIHVIFTCVPEPQISKVYRHLLERGVRCVETLPGFVPDRLAQRPVSPLAARPFDVVYRGRPCPYELGDLAQEKVSIAVRFNELAPKFELTADVDWREEARIYGDCWTEFMASGRTALGTESGASIVDFDGELARTVAAYREQYPEASYREVADKFLAPYEGNVVINTISPRAFEAIALRTALVLFPGNYSGVLQAGRHYISLAKDFSNFAEVAGLLKNTAFLEQMAAITFDEVVAPGRYSYAAFARSVDSVMEEEWQARIAPTAKRRSLLFDAEKWRATLTAQVSAILNPHSPDDALVSATLTPIQI